MNVSFLRVTGFSRRPPLRSIAARGGQALFAVLGASVLIWSLLPLAPGDTALRTLQAQGRESPSETEMAAVRRALKLDEPLVVQYVSWLGRAARGDLSTSFQSGRPVTAEIAERLPATLLLTGAALLCALALTLTIGLSGAAFVGRWPDAVGRAASQFGASVPAFLLGLLSLYLVVVALGWGRVIAGGNLGDVWLPALCLGVGRAAEWGQLLRANLLEALGAKYALVAAARGASRWRVLWRYALPNALLPLCAVVGVGLGSLLGGAAIVETVFSWPGVGSYAVQAIAARDLPAVQGFVVVGTLFYVASSLLADLAGAAIDPRRRHPQGVA